MNWPNFALTKAQQAPVQPLGWIPPCSSVAQKVRFVPVHCASMNSQRMISGSVQAMSRIATMVSAASDQVAKRLTRAHRTMPRSPIGGGSDAAISRRT
jgi:hypothetical protein